MGRGKKFLMDAAPLALAGVVLRAVTVSFNSYVSKKLGAEAMGLYGLVMSVGTFGIVLASSGVNLAAVRLTAAAAADGVDRARMRSINASFATSSGRAITSTATPVSAEPTKTAATRRT